MKERHGVADAFKLSLDGTNSACVYVTDGNRLVHLHLESAPWGAGLTPQQARWIARELERSALRIEAQPKDKATPK